VGATLAQLGCGGLPNDKKPKRSQRYCTWQSWSPLENFAVGYLSRSGGISPTFFTLKDTATLVLQL
ncbi:unnamed protein product, partial [Effrenium voratum]